MAQHVQTIKIAWNQQGQPRPYADHTYDAILEFETTATYDWDPPRPIVLNMARAIMNCGFFKDITEPYDFYETHAKKVEKIAKGKWHIVVVTPYID